MSAKYDKNVTEVNLRSKKLFKKIQMSNKVIFPKQLEKFDIDRMLKNVKITFVVFVLKATRKFFFISSTDIKVE